MTLQAWLVGFAVSTVYGALFHLWLGGGSRRLALYLLAAWLGFALGQYVGDALSLSVLRIGPLNFLTATLGSLVALAAARVLVIADDRAKAK